MARRRSGGTIRQLPSGRYQARVTQGKDAQGRQRQRSLGRSFPTRKAAEAALRAHAVDVARGLIKPPAELTVAELIDRSLAERRSTLSPKTLSTYRGATRLHLLPALGHLRVQAFTRGDLRRFYLRLVDKDLSRSLLRTCRAVLDQAFEEALEDELISRNPVRQVKLPACKPEQEGRALTPDETQRLFEAVGDHPFRQLLTLKLVTGLRRGEVCALNWQHLDFEQAELQVVESLKVVDGQPMRGSTKTPSSVRVIHLATETIELLQAHQARQRAQGLACGPEDAVFTTTRRRRPHPDSVSHFTSQALRRAGIGDAHLHSLRTTFTSLARRAGVPLEVISRSLGHADTRVTAQRYLKTYDDERRAHALGLSELLGPPNLRLNDRSA